MAPQQAYIEPGVRPLFLEAADSARENMRDSFRPFARAIETINVAAPLCPGFNARDDDEPQPGCVTFGVVMPMGLQGVSGSPGLEHS